MGKGAGASDAKKVRGGKQATVVTAADAKPGDEKPMEVFIDGKLYDVTDFMKKHPGGTVLKFYVGENNDATQAFHNFHIRSEKAIKTLASLPNRTPTDVSKYNPRDKQAEMLADFNAMTKEFEDKGYFKPSILHVLYRVAEIILMHAIGFYLLLQVSGRYQNPINSWDPRLWSLEEIAADSSSSSAVNGSEPNSWDIWRFAGLFVLGVAQGRCGWLMHEGGHNSLTGAIKLDKIIQIFMYGVGCGMSGSWWRSQHNRHHAMPQKVGMDPDLDTLPLVLFSSTVVKDPSKLSGFQKLWVKVQPFLFPIITTVTVSLGWQYFLHLRHIMRKKEPLEALAIGIRHYVIYQFLGLKYGLQTTVLMYLFYMWVGANYIFINFAVSHTHLPTVAKDDSSVDWVRYAAVHTMNVKAGPLNFVNWWMSYLNFQIEHHLYPAMPQFRHPKVSPRIQEFFAKHGLEYTSMGYLEAMAVTFKNLDKVGDDVYLG